MHEQIYDIKVFIVARFSYGFDEWKSIYDDDYDLSKQFMKDGVIGKVNENCAIIKFTITDPDKMNQVMLERMP